MIQERRKFIEGRLGILSQVMKEIPELQFLGASETLRQKAKVVSNKEGLEIGDKLLYVLLKYRQLTGFGRGIAAPQIGLDKRVFVTFLNDNAQIFINPRVVWKSESNNFYREMCMSSGMMWADVQRAQEIRMEYNGRYGDRKTEKAESVMARLWQHECDHLDGVVNLDIAEIGSIELVSSDPLVEKLRNTRT